MNIVIILFLIVGIVGLFLPNDNGNEVMEKYCKLECKSNMIHMHCC